MPAYISLTQFSFQRD